MVQPTRRRLEYPESRRGACVETLHGIEVADPYRWLEEIDSEETRAWVAAQNRLTTEFLNDLPNREAIHRTVSELWNFEKIGCPHERGGRIVLTLNDGLSAQPTLRLVDETGRASGILLDPNRLSEDGTTAISGFRLGPDGDLLAYGLSSAGSDWQTWRIRDVETGVDLEDLIEWTKFTLPAWAPDGSGFYYSRFDKPASGEAYKAANVDQRLVYHTLGTPQETDRVVYERPDHPEWRFFAETTDDGRYVVITVARGTHRETGLCFIDLRRDADEVVELTLEFDASYLFAGSDGSAFYVLTDLDAPRSRLLAIDVTRPAPADWTEVLPESDEPLERVYHIGGRFLAVTLRDAAHRLAVYDSNGAHCFDLPLPGVGTVGEASGRAGDPHAYVQYTDFTAPETVYRFDVATGERSVFLAPRLPFDPADYVVERTFYESADGTRVPIFLGRKRVASGAAPPTFLYGYGGFNIPLTPTFSVAHFAWMAMGGLFVQACIRGGGEYGVNWHEAGRRQHRQNAFDDFIAAADWLVNEGHTERERLAIGGRSNGGLLVGACMTQRPDLCGACLTAVGVHDMLRFHKFTVGWGWTSDFGSPDDAEMFPILRGYSPYHNLRPGTLYPPTLVTTADHDDRVFPAHSYKFAAALQACQAGDAPTLIRIDERAGHGLGKPTGKLIAEVTDGWTFLWDALGTTPS